MEEWLAAIREVGFPVAVSFYLLHRIEARLQAIQDALLALRS